MRKYIFFLLAVLVLSLLIFKHISADSELNIFSFNLAEPTSQNNAQNSSLEIENLEYGFFLIHRNLINDIELTIESTGYDNKEPNIIGVPLNYPNPFKFGEGTELHYTLNTDADVELRIYNVAAREILKLNFDLGFSGGSFGENVVLLTPATFNYSRLPCGLYYYLLISHKKIIGKGKMVIEP